MPMLKANAYGHGLEAVARCLAPQADAFGVALVEEGIVLRRLGIEKPILVTGGTWTRQIPLFLEHRLTLTVPSLARLRDVDEAAAAAGRKATVHLKIDTGMERIGVHHYNAERPARGRRPLAARRGRGHLHAPRERRRRGPRPRPPAARTFLGGAPLLRAPLAAPAAAPRRELGRASSGFAESHLDLVRPGILLYGVYPAADAPHTVEVKPALSWRSRVVYFKVVEPGSPVSYGSTWQSDHRVRMVTVPVGYGDGYFRSMSNRAQVVLRGERRPQVGTICMDQMMVNIEWGSAWNGDEVMLIGEQDGARVTVEELAQWAGTIPYEILTAINARVPRLYEG